LKIGQDNVDAASSELNWYERDLDLRNAILSEQFEFLDEERRQTIVRTLRCALLTDPHVLLQEIEINCTNHSQPIRIEISPEDPDFELRHPHLDVTLKKTQKKLSDLRLFETKKSKIKICYAARASIENWEQGECVKLFPEQGKPIKLQRFVTIYTSRDTEDVVRAARERVQKLQWDQFGQYLSEQNRHWQKFWSLSDIEVEGNDSVTHMLRFNSYHLRIAAPIEQKTSIPARALSGRAYEGHIFWDAEVFMLPFLLYTWPDLAENMLSYRYYTLDGARKRAKSMGHEGACYAWESTVSGLDATPKVIRLEGTKAEVPIFTGTQQIHITGSVAHGVLQYWRVTGNDKWMTSHGAEILFETSRFWVSRAKYRGSEYHIDDVVGPDEYHHGVDDNTYTNWLARHNLAGALEVAQWLQSTNRRAWDELSARLKLKTNEIKGWQDMVERIYLPTPNSKGVFPQFKGFFDLKDVPLKSEEKYRAPFQRLLNWKEVNSAKIVKQADFLMTPFLFPEAFSEEQLRANFHYYERITDHGSSLSPCVHSAIAARIGEYEFVSRYWQAGLKLDLHNLMKNTALGFHAACAAGTWQALVFHILGVPLSGNLMQFPQNSENILPVLGDAVRLNLVRQGKIYSYDIRRPKTKKRAA
jgi:trehalose/maltose hydrolase-like predicted phosphorylase